jgi:ribosomal protein S18 acetylase RimI-like enzyme
MTDRLPPVYALLNHNEYEREEAAMWMHWRDFDPLPPQPFECEADVLIDWRASHNNRPSLTVRAERDGQELGICIAGSLCSHSEDAGAQQTLTIHWLNVDDPAPQLAGLGRHLLQRALVEMHGKGYRHCVLHMSPDANRPVLLYSSMGFEFFDRSYTMRGSLGSNNNCTTSH